MILDVIGGLLIWFLFAVMISVWIWAAAYPRARTVGMPPKEIVKVRYDFRDDAPEIMQMLRKRYKSKDWLRKAKNVVDHIYQMYENRCKKCTK